MEIESSIIPLSIKTLNRTTELKIHVYYSSNGAYNPVATQIANAILHVVCLVMGIGSI